MHKRPAGWPIMYQSWGSLLFMHWRIPVQELRPLIPDRLSIDTFAGSAWIAVTPFTMWNVRPVFVPPLPGISAFHEVNCRTYVVLDDEPGVWFFSLDANSRLASAAARLLYQLPYNFAGIDLHASGGTVDYYMSRPEAFLHARWHIREELSQSLPESLEFFLTERYCLYTESRGKIYRCRIHHKPWPLQTAVLEAYETNLFEANRIPQPTGPPIVWGGGPVDVEVWPLEAA